LGYGKNYFRTGTIFFGEQVIDRQLTDAHAHGTLENNDNAFESNLMKTPTPLDEWMAQRSNSMHFLKRGQVQNLLSSIGIGRKQIDTLWPEGSPARKRLRGCENCYYVRSVVLSDLGVSTQTTL
jgi:hypothetical protein